MKKVLALVLILGMASMANATFSLSIDDQKGQGFVPAPAEITLMPSDTIVIGCFSQGGRDSNLYQDTYYLSEGLFRLSNLVGGELGDIGEVSMYNNTDFDAVEIWAGMGHTSGAAPAGMIYSVLFHCEGPGDVTVELYDEFFGFEAPVQSLIIHQIPEPMTMSLLALGGLGMLRRRR